MTMLGLHNGKKWNDFACWGKWSISAGVDDMSWLSWLCMLWIFFERRDKNGSIVWLCMLWNFFETLYSGNRQGVKTYSGTIPPISSVSVVISQKMEGLCMMAPTILRSLTHGFGIELPMEPMDLVLSCPWNCQNPSLIAIIEIIFHAGASDRYRPESMTEILNPKP